MLPKGKNEFEPNMNNRCGEQSYRIRIVIKQPKA